MKNEVQWQKAGLLGMLPAALGASILGNMLAGKWVLQACEGVLIASKGEKSKSQVHGVIGTRQDF